MVETELSADEHKQLLQGVRIDIPLSRMTPKHQELACLYCGGKTMDKATFYFTRSDRGQKYLVRDLLIGAGVGGNYGVGGTISALAWGLRREAANAWILPGDAKSSDRETVFIHALPDISSQSPWGSAPELDQLLTKVAEAQHISYIAVIPDDIRRTNLPHAQKELGKFCEELQRSTNLMHKWRNDVLLFNSPDWFYGNATRSPYSAVKQVGEHQK